MTIAADRSSTRLELNSNSNGNGNGNGSGRYDGRWWPRSRDLRIELPTLIVALGEHGMSVARVSYNLEFWRPVPPRKLDHDRQRIRLGGFRTMNPHEICTLDAYGGSRLTLEVVPPQPADAERASWEYRWP